MLSMLMLITSAVIFVITRRKEKDGNVDIDALVSNVTLLVVSGITTRRKYRSLQVASWLLAVIQVRAPNVIV